MEQETSDRQIAVSDAPGTGPGDPLDAVTEFDTRALDHRCGVFRGSDAEGVLRVNDDFLTITGLSPSAARGWDWLASVHADDRERLRRAVEAACRSGARSAFPIRMQVPLGNITTLSVAIRALPTADGSRLFVGAVESPTDADARRASAHRGVDRAVPVDPFEVLVDALPVAVAYAAPDGTLEFANAAWRERVGSSDTMAEVFATSSGAGSVPVLEALDAWAPWSGYAAVAGAETEVTVVPLAEQLGGGHVIALVPGPVLPTPNATSPLELCCAVLDASPDFAVVLDANGGLTYANTAARDFLGLGDADLPSPSSLAELMTFADSHPRPLRERLPEVLASKGSLTVAGDVVKADGTRCPVAMLIVAIKDESGAVDAMVCIARDGADLERAERQLHAREAWFRTLMQHTSDAVTVLDAHLVVGYASPSCEAILHAAPEALTGTRFLDHVDGPDVALVEAAISEAELTHLPTTIRYRVARSDGWTRTFESRIEDRLDDAVIAGITVNTRDVTEVEREATARDRSEAAFRTVVRSAPAAIYAVDLEGRIQLWNPACEAMFGWTADEVVGFPPPFLSDAQRADPWTSSARVLAAGEEFNAEAVFRRRDGSEVAVGLSVAPIVAGDGAVTSVITVALDLTERVKATERLAHRAEVDRTVSACARALVDTTPATFAGCLEETLHALADQFRADAAALFLRDEQRAVSTWPSGAELDLGLALDDCPPGPFTAPDATGAVVGAGWVMAGESGPLGVVALRWDRPIMDDVTDLESLDVVGAAIIAARDRVLAETAVRESELRFRTLAEHSTDLVVVVGPDLQPRYVSPAAARFLGVMAHDRFDPASSVIHPDDVTGLQAEMSAIAGSEVGARSEPILARLLRADGEYRWVELMVTNLLAEPLVGGLVVNARDVTERLDAEDQLRASEAKFRGLVQNLAEGVTVLAIDGSVKYSSPSAARMLGYEVGHGTGEIALDFVLEEDRDRAAEIVAKAFSEPGIQGPVALRILRPDGTTRVVEAMGHNRLDDPAVEGVVVTTRDISERVEAETSARRSDARLSALVENLSDVVTIVNPDGELVYTSPAAEAQFGFREGDESWTDPTARMHPDDRDAAIEQLGRQIAGETQEPVQFRLRDAAGGWRNVEAIASDMTDDPDVGGIVVTTRDVSARTLAERLVADQAQVLTLIARGAPLSDTLSALCEIIERIVGDVLCGFLVLDPERQVLGLEAGPRIPTELAAICQGIPVRRTAVTRPGTEVIVDLDADPRSAGFRDIADRSGVSAVWSTPIFDSLAQRVIGTVAMFFAGPREPTPAEHEVLQMFSQTAAIAIERQSAEDLLAHRANHDSLTGLPNRVLFLEFLSHALARAERDDGKVAVLFLDLDRFKHINDGLGHDAGDEVLRELAQRLDSVMRPADVVARFGGDEFTILCEGLDPERVADHVADIARRLLEVVEQPLSVGGEDRRLSASVGIAVAGRGCTAEALLRDSDAAMYEAKQRGKARWEIFDDAMRSSVTARLDLESRLERAIERDEFRLYLQPIIELASGRCVGAEALLRWQDPDKGLVTPDAFIGLAEETGLIIPIGEWALAEACRTVAHWEAVGLLSSEFTMSVNLSARQVAQTDLVERVRAVIERSGPMASRLCLEITESVLMEESSVDAMHALRELGVRFSIDDFGTGYSSLGYLKRFPVDSVKVDRSFVDGLGTDGEDSAIVAAVVSLGHALGLSVVAEGVETSGQLQHLLALGCDRAQGYWFSGPRNATEFAGMLNDQPWIGTRTAWAGPPAPVERFGSRPAS